MQQFSSVHVTKYPCWSLDLSENRCNPELTCPWQLHWKGESCRQFHHGTAVSCQALFPATSTLRADNNSCTQLHLTQDVLGTFHCICVLYPGIDDFCTNHPLDPGTSDSVFGTWLRPGTSDFRLRHRLYPGASDFCLSHGLDPGTSDLCLLHWLVPETSDLCLWHRLDPGTFSRYCCILVLLISALLWYSFILDVAKLLTPGRRI